MTQAFNPADVILLAPEIIITVTALLVLLVDLVVRGSERIWLASLSILGVVITLGSLARQVSTGPSRVVVFSGLHAVDSYASFFKAVFLLSAVIVILLAARHIREQGIDAGGFYSLLLFATLGTMLMASAVDLLSLFVGLETMSVCTYALCGLLKRDQRCNEGALKYLLMGAFSSGVPGPGPY